MSQEEIAKELTDLNGKVDEIMTFIRKTDIKTNGELSEILGHKSRKTLKNWYAAGCPRESSTHGSLSEILKWRRETATRKSE